MEQGIRVHSGNGQTSKETGHQVQLTQQDISDCIFDYYVKLISEQLPSLVSTIPQEFVKVQNQIINVVELRKTMQKTIEIDLVQSEHFTTVSSLLQQNYRLQSIISEMTQQIKALQNKNMQFFIQSLLSERESSKKNELFSHDSKILAEISDLRRTINLDYSLHECNEQDRLVNLDELQIKEWPYEAQFDHIIEQQKQKWKFTKLIYANKFRQLQLRQQMIDEREQPFFQYEKSNSQLIQSLLREKQRDKNLRKKDKEKFEQMLKLRHELDLQNEYLNHSEKTMIQYLQNECQRVKSRLKERDEEYQNIAHKYQSLQQKIQQENKRFDECNRQTTNKYNLEINQLKNKHFKLASERQQTEKQRRQANEELGSVKLAFEALRETVTKQERQNEELQSKYNQMLLKSSQLHHLRSEAVSKLEKALQTNEMLEKTNESLKSKLQQRQQLLIERQNQTKLLQLAFQSKETELKSSLQEISRLKYCLGENESKIAHLQDELTVNFISQNSERNSLLHELQQKAAQIALLNQQIQVTSHSQDSGMYDELKLSLLRQLKMGQQIRSGMINSFVNKLDQLIS